jgi:hypothetical protein
MGYKIGIGVKTASKGVQAFLKSVAHLIKSGAITAKDAEAQFKAVEAKLKPDGKNDTTNIKRSNKVGKQLPSEQQEVPKEQ